MTRKRFILLFAIGALFFIALTLAATSARADNAIIREEDDAKAQSVRQTPQIGPEAGKLQNRFI